jgi:hypothetical protein
MNFFIVQLLSVVISKHPFYEKMAVPSTTDSGESYSRPWSSFPGV